MVSIEQTVTVTPERKITIQVPSIVTTGEHRIIVIIDTKPIRSSTKLDLVPLRLNTSSDFTYRREDICGDTGR